MELITIKTFDNTISAHILMSRLENEGIKCFLFDENIVSIHPLLNVTVGGIKLKVNGSDVDKAKTVLREIDNSPMLDEQDKVICCPTCNSTQLYAGFKSVKSVAGIISAFISFALSIFPIYFKTVYRCKDCGTEFKENL